MRRKVDRDSRANDMYSHSRGRTDWNVPCASNEKDDENGYMSAHSIKRHCTALGRRRKARFSCPT